MDLIEEECVNEKVTKHGCDSLERMPVYKPWPMIQCARSSHLVFFFKHTISSLNLYTIFIY